MALAMAAPMTLWAADDAGTERGLKALRAETPIAELQQALRKGTLSSEDLTKGALAMIAAKNPKLHAVIAINPQALALARQNDIARKKGTDLGPLMGIPILIKDNIETLDPIATTAGSLALKDNVTHRDAPMAARLRSAGAIIVGKTNLSEWANIRSSHSVSGWSAMGGLTANPYDPTRSACGSSSGSGAAIAADLAVIAVGTETDGSVICPSSFNGLVGLKPTVGLVSRTHVVPISHSQDTPGPMGHTVRDVALLLNEMAGVDPDDEATAEADQHRADFSAGLKDDALKGVRIGVMKDQIGDNWKISTLFDKALARLQKAGAVLVDIPDTHVDGLGDAEFLVLLTELKADLNRYLVSTPPTVKARSLSELIAFNRAHEAEEMPYFRQETFEKAEQTKGLDDPAYIAARDKAKSLGAERIDGLLRDNDVALLIAPSKMPAPPSDLINGDRPGGPSVTKMPATSGYPHLTVPMGKIQGLPVGISFLGPKWGEALLLQAGYAFERTQ